MNIQNIQIEISDAIEKQAIINNSPRFKIIVIGISIINIIVIGITLKILSFLINDPVMYILGKTADILISLNEMNFFVIERIYLILTGTLLILLLAIIFIIVLYIIASVYKNINFFRSIYKNILSNLYYSNIDILTKSLTLNSIDEVIHISREIFFIIRKIHKSKFLLHLMYGNNTIIFYDTLILKELELLNEVLLGLRTDLAIRLIEQQAALESAKSEVEENIKGNTKLNQVSELQQARLDKQIEQFEELQRVLIKT